MSPDVTAYSDQADALLRDVLDHCRWAEESDNPIMRSEISDAVFGRLTGLEPELLATVVMFAAKRIVEWEEAV